MGLVLQGLRLSAIFISRRRGHLLKRWLAGLPLHDQEFQSFRIGLRLMLHIYVSFSG